MLRRVLITGRGSIARRHAALLRELVPGAQLGVVARGPVEASFQPCAIFGDFAQGMDWHPDAVVIASVSSSHAGELEAVLAAGVPCLAEKPLVTSRDQLNRLRERSGAPLVQVGCNLRHLPALGRLRSLLAEGVLGALVRAHFEVGLDLATWRPGRDVAGTYSADPARGGGVVFDLVHEIDLALWLLGPLEVRAALGGRRSSLPVKGHDTHVALLAARGNAPVTVALDCVATVAVRRYSLVGEQATIVCDLASRHLAVSSRSGSRIVAEGDAEFDIAQSYRLQMKNWLSAMQGRGTPLLCPLSDGMETAALMLSMQEAA